MLYPEPAEVEMTVISEAIEYVKIITLWPPLLLLYIGIVVIDIDYDLK